MAKSWRNKNAQKINTRRAAGSKEPSARQQMRIQHHVQGKVKGAGNWLLACLLIRAGIQGDLPSTIKTHLHEPTIPQTEGFLKRQLRKMMKFAANYGTRYA